MGYSLTHKFAGAVIAVSSLVVTTHVSQAQTLPKGGHEWGVSTDYITNLSNRRTNARFVGISGEYGYFQTSRRELLIGASVLHTTTPSSSTSALGTIGIRQHLRSSGKIIPYIQVGVGVMYNGLDTNELNKGFQFHEKLGIGIRYFINEKSSINLEAGGFHVSNAGLRDKNVGINAGYVALGYNRFFD